MLISTTITSKWQMTIPRKVRKTLNLTRTGRVMITVDPKQKAFMIHETPSIFDLAGTFTPKDKKKIINAVKIRDYMETHYEPT